MMLAELPLTQEELQRIQALMDEKLGECLTVASMAAFLGRSVSQFSRSFRDSVDMPPHRYLLTRRLQKARDLLASTQMSVAQIAVATGFCDQSHLCHFFRRHLGISPNAFRRQHR